MIKWKEYVFGQTRARLSPSFVILAFVDFEDEEGAKKALSLSGTLLINNLQVIIQRRGGPDNTPKVRADFDLIFFFGF
jgi:hypothetical protein